jgi:hypothetical protein
VLDGLALLDLQPFERQCSIVLARLAGLMKRSHLRLLISQLSIQICYLLLVLTVFSLGPQQLILVVLFFVLHLRCKALHFSPQLSIPYPQLLPLALPLLGSL